MVEFVVETKDFKKAISQILVGRREYLHQDTADLIAVADSLAVRSTGTSAEIDAVGCEGPRGSQHRPARQGAEGSGRRLGFRYWCSLESCGAAKERCGWSRPSGLR